MKKMRPSKKRGMHQLRWLALGAVLATSMIAGIAMVDRGPQFDRDIRQGARVLLSENSLIGDMVVNHKGEPLGAINDVVIDMRGGRLVYALVSPEGFLGSNDEVIPIPWESLTRDALRREFVLETAASDLKNAPRFFKDKAPDLNDPCWDGEYQRFDDRPIPEDLAKATP